MGDLIHIISWERFCEKDNLNDLDKYAQFPMHQYPGLLDIRNLNLKQVGPTLQELPDNCLKVLIEKSSLLLDHRNDSDSISGLDTIFKLLCLIARNTKNTDKLMESGAIKVVVRYVDMSMNKLAKETDMEWLNLFEYLLYFLEIVFDPTFSWRRRKKVYYSETSATEENSCAVKVIQITNETVIWMCSQLNDFANERDLFNRLLHLLCSIISGSKNNAQQLITPAIVDIFTLRSDVNAEIMASFCFIIASLSELPTVQRQEDLTGLVIKLITYLGDKPELRIHDLRCLTQLIEVNRELCDELIRCNIFSVFERCLTNENIDKEKCRISFTILSKLTAGPCQVRRQFILLNGYDRMLEILERNVRQSASLLDMVFSWAVCRDFDASKVSVGHYVIGDGYVVGLLIKWGTNLAISFDDKYDSSNDAEEHSNGTVESVVNWKAIFKLIMELCQKNRPSTSECCASEVISVVCDCVKLACKRMDEVVPPVMDYDNENLCAKVADAKRKCEDLLNGLFHLLEMFTGYSITGKDLVSVVRLFKDKHSRSRGRRIIKMFNNIVSGSHQNSDIDCWFEFSEPDDSILIYPVRESINFTLGFNSSNFVETIPSKVLDTLAGKINANSFSFHCWLNLTPMTVLEKVNSGHERSCIFRLLTESLNGFEAFLNMDGQLLVATCHQGEFHYAQITSKNISKKATFFIEENLLKPDKWHMLNLVFQNARNFFGRATVSVYIDGTLVNTVDLKYPQINEKISIFHIGGFPKSVSNQLKPSIDTKARRKSSFLGNNTIKRTWFGDEHNVWGRMRSLKCRIVSVACFNDALTEAAISSLYLKGPGTCLSIVNDELLNGNILVNYHALTYDPADQCCRNLHPYIQSSKHIQYHCGYLKGDRLDCIRLEAAINEIGGMSSLLPIIEQLDFMQLSSDMDVDSEDGYRFKDSSPNRVIGRMVSTNCGDDRFITVPDRKSDEQLDDSILASIIILFRKMTLVGINQQLMERTKCIEIIGCFLQKMETIFIDMNVAIAFHALADQCGINVSAKIYQMILLDWRIWSRCNNETRLRHAIFVGNLVKHEITLFRSQYGVGFFLDVIQQYHRPYMIDGTDVNKNIRAELYTVIYIIVHKHPSSMDYQKMIRFVHECNKDALIQEMLELLTRLFDSESIDQNCMLFYDSKLMETLFVLLVRDLSASTKEATIKFLYLLISSPRVPDKAKDHLLLSDISFASIFVFKAFYESAISSVSIRSLLHILQKAAGKDLFGVVQFLSLLTLSPVEQRVSAMKTLKLIFDKAPDAILAISMQPGWQDILIHQLVAKKREDIVKVIINMETVMTENVQTRNKESNSNERGFKRSSTWAFDESLCDNSVSAEFDEILEEEEPYSLPGNVTDKPAAGDIQDAKSIDTIFLTTRSPENSEMNQPVHICQHNGAYSSFLGNDNVSALTKDSSDPSDIDLTEEEHIIDSFNDELITITLQCLHRVIWSVLSSSSGVQAWMSVHQVMESLRNVNDRYVMLKSLHFFKQKILIGLLKSTIKDWKATELFPQQNILHANELLRLVVDCSYAIVMDDEYEYESELLELTITLLQDCLKVWDDDSEYQELAALGFHYLLTLSCDPNMEIVSAVCARLHHVITSLSKNITYDEVAFILVHLDRALIAVIDTENYYFLAPVIKTILEHHEDMLQVSMYLGNISSKTPEFYDYFKEYCGQLEWKTFIKSRLYSACEIFESSYLNEMTTGQSLWRAQANEQMSRDRKNRVAMALEHRKRLENEIVSLTITWIKDEHRRKDHKSNELQIQHESILKQWRILKQSLIGSKGCWKDEDNPSIVHLKQSCRENYLRMRPRFEINYQFNNHIDASTERDHPRMCAREPEPDPMKCLSALEGKIDFSALGDDQLGDDEWISIQNIEQVDTNATITNSPKQTGGSRKYKFDCRCKLIAFTEIVDGKFELTSSHFMFQGSSVSVDALDLNNSKIMCSINHIREVHLRRYNLRRSAIEIFLTDQTNYFFNFDTKMRDKVYSKILSLRPANLVYSKQRSPADMLKSSYLTHKWVNREISNFEYLMQLNTIAGRTYNDMSQYPVFPWILADYESPTLDLDDPRVFRDLSKPIGIVNPKNEDEVREKYEGFEDPSGIIAKFHYGTHYSSAAGVMHYMVRMEPFTTMHIQLQGGKFDVADRQFHSIPMSWRFIMESPSDNKELIPEFFYQPQFLRNENKFDFGKLQQTKTPIDDVELPPWASSPEDFIYKHRQALESEHVSMNLHNWIDLIFGYKQKGIEAVKALNVFYYVTYEGVVDLDQIQDPYERESIESMINNFGQTPCQLLKNPHPRRMTLEAVRNQMIKIDKCLPVVPNMAYLKHTSKSICSTWEPITFVRVPPGQARSLMGPDRSLSMITIHSSNIIAKHTWTPNSKGSGSGYYLDVEPIFDSPITRRKNYLGVLSSSVKSNNQLYTVTPDCKYVIAGGNSNNRLTILSMARRSDPIMVASPHHRPISCVSIDIDAMASAVAPVVSITGIVSSTYIGMRLYGMTGSLDSSCVIWDWSDLPVANVHQVLSGHQDPVTSVSLSVYLDIAVSGSLDGTVNLYSVSKGQFLRSVVPGGDLVPGNLSVNFVVQDRLGHLYIQWQTHRSSLVRQRHWLSLYSLHGDHLSTEDISHGPVTLVTVLAQSSGALDTVVMVGTGNGHLIVLDGHDLTERNSLWFNDSVLDACVLCPGAQYLAVALASGQLIISAVSLSALDH